MGFFTSQFICQGLYIYYVIINRGPGSSPLPPCHVNLLLQIPTLPSIQPFLPTPLSYSTFLPSNSLFYSTFIPSFLLHLPSFQLHSPAPPSFLPTPFSYSIFIPSNSTFLYSFQLHSPTPPSFHPTPLSYHTQGHIQGGGKLELLNL